MDTAASDIRAAEFTASSDGDNPVLPDLPDQIPEAEEIGTATAPMPRDAATPRSSRSARTDGLGRKMPGRNRQKRHPESLTPLWQGIQEALDGIPTAEPDRGQDAQPQTLR